MARNTEVNQQRVNSIVEGTKIVGEISSPGNFRIDGTVEGTIQIEGRLIIGAKGQVLGKVTCKDADVEGRFKGELQVNGLLSLKAQASIEGDATFQRLTVEDGAKLKCTCNLSSEKPASAKPLRDTSKDILSEPPKADRRSVGVV